MLCMCFEDMCTVCGYCRHRVWVLWVSLFSFIDWTCSWKHVFRFSMGVWRSCQSWCIAEPGLVGHQWTQRLVNLVFCILLIGPQKPLHPSDLFFIFSHVSSGDVSKAFSKFPFGTCVPQERVAPWHVIGGHFRTFLPGCLYLPESLWQLLCAGCLLPSSSQFQWIGFLHLCLQCQQHWEFPVHWSWGHGSPVETSGEKVRVFWLLLCSPSEEIFLGSMTWASHPVVFCSENLE